MPETKNPSSSGAPQDAKPQESPQESPQRKPENSGQQNGVKVIRFKESDIAQRWLVTTEFCPDCARAKKDFKKEIKEEKLKIADVGSDKGFDIITKLGLFETPVFIIELKDGTYLIDE